MTHSASNEILYRAPLQLNILRRGAMLGVAAMMAVMMAPTGLAQDQDQTPPPPSQDETTDEPVPSDEPASDETQRETEPAPPSLDDLLGIVEEERDRSAADAADREVEDELQRELTGQAIADAFVQAVEKMALSADLLDVKLDAGLGTQRVQEDILAKLQSLIDAARKMQNSMSSSSSSSSQSQSQQQAQRRSQPDQQSGSNQRNATGENRSEMDPPPPEAADPNAPLDETGREWGNLPERIREQLLQGRRDAYSRIYDRLTREYYQRLAEENSP